MHVVHTYIPTAIAAVVAAGKLSMTPESTDAVRVEDAFRFCQIERLANAYGVTSERLHVEMGAAEECLTRTVANYRIDIMIMGTSSHGRLHRMIIGSTASAVLESLPCDILIVRALDVTQVTPS